MELRIYQVDAFHHQVLKGNPAAVIPLAHWLPDEQLQAIASENNLSETAFFLPPQDDGTIPLRWFTPMKEVRLCGHATLATAHVLFKEIGYTQTIIPFSTLSGILKVSQEEQQYKMEFPADLGKVTSVPDGFTFPVQDAIQGKDDLLLILNTADDVRQFEPPLQQIAALNCRGLIVSAEGDTDDFVSRCFYPTYGINEDPVTGSAHTLLTPYWAKRLDRNTLSARQISQREGILGCSYLNEKVYLKGSATTYMRGQIYLND